MSETMSETIEALAKRFFMLDKERKECVDAIQEALGLRGRLLVHTDDEARKCPHSKHGEFDTFVLVHSPPQDIDRSWPPTVTYRAGLRGVRCTTEPLPFSLAESIGKMVKALDQ